MLRAQPAAQRANMRAAICAPVCASGQGNVPKPASNPAKPQKKSLIQISDKKAAGDAAPSMRCVAGRTSPMCARNAAPTRLRRMQRDRATKLASKRCRTRVANGDI